MSDFKSKKLKTNKHKHIDLPKKHIHNAKFFNGFQALELHLFWHFFRHDWLISVLKFWVCVHRLLINYTFCFSNTKLLTFCSFSLENNNFSLSFDSRIFFINIYSKVNLICFVRFYEWNCFVRKFRKARALMFFNWCVTLEYIKKSSFMIIFCLQHTPYETRTTVSPNHLKKSLFIISAVLFNLFPFLWSYSRECEK